jgi:hypothetical protein
VLVLFALSPSYAASFRSAQDAPGAWQEFAILVKAHFLQTLAADAAAVRSVHDLLAQTDKEKEGPLAFIVKE